MPRYSNGKNIDGKSGKINKKEVEGNIEGSKLEEDDEAEQPTPQDHNYGQNNNGSEESTPIEMIGGAVDSGWVMRCHCGSIDDDGGSMICCDSCSSWQHLECVGIDKKRVPASYLCDICRRDGKQEKRKSSDKINEIRLKVKIYSAVSENSSHDGGGEDVKDCVISVLNNPVKNLENSPRSMNKIDGLESEEKNLASNDDNSYKRDHQIPKNNGFSQPSLCYKNELETGQKIIKCKKDANKDDILERFLVTRMITDPPKDSFEYSPRIFEVKCADENLAVIYCRNVSCLTKYVRRSCSPNSCIFSSFYTVEGVQQNYFELRAIRSIKKDDEITIAVDRNHKGFNDEHPVPTNMHKFLQVMVCNCQSRAQAKNCWVHSILKINSRLHDEIDTDSDNGDGFSTSASGFDESDKYSSNNRHNSHASQQKKSMSREDRKLQFYMKIFSQMEGPKEKHGKRSAPNDDSICSNSNETSRRNHGHHSSIISSNDDHNNNNNNSMQPVIRDVSKNSKMRRMSASESASCTTKNTKCERSNLKRDQESVKNFKSASKRMRMANKDCWSKNPSDCDNNMNLEIYHYDKLFTDNQHDETGSRTNSSISEVNYRTNTMAETINMDRDVPLSMNDHHKELDINDASDSSEMKFRADSPTFNHPDADNVVSNSEKSSIVNRASPHFNQALTQVLCLEKYIQQLSSMSSPAFKRKRERILSSDLLRHLNVDSIKLYKDPFSPSFLFYKNIKERIQTDDEKNFQTDSVVDHKVDVYTDDSFDLENVKFSESPSSELNDTKIIKVIPRIWKKRQLWLNRTSSEHSSTPNSYYESIKNSHMSMDHIDFSDRNISSYTQNTDVSLLRSSPPVSSKVPPNTAASDFHSVASSKHQNDQQPVDSIKNVIMGNKFQSSSDDNTDSPSPRLPPYSSYTQNPISIDSSDLTDESSLREIRKIKNDTSNFEDCKATVLPESSKSEEYFANHSNESNSNQSLKKRKVSLSEYRQRHRSILSSHDSSSNSITISSEYNSSRTDSPSENSIFITTNLSFNQSSPPSSLTKISNSSSTLQFSSSPSKELSPYDKLKASIADVLSLSNGTGAKLSLINGSQTKYLPKNQFDLTPEFSTSDSSHSVDRNGLADSSNASDGYVSNKPPCNFGSSTNSTLNRDILWDR